MKITVNPYSKGSIDEAVKQIREYAKWLEKKTEELKQRVANELQELVAAGFNGSEYDVLTGGAGVSTPDVSVTVDEAGKATLVIAHGKEALFVEFGAGVYFNAGGAYPGVRPEGVVSIGEYGEGHGKRRVWGFYDEGGELRLTYGTPASAPMYNAVQEITRRYVDIAKEVFKE